MSDDAIRVLLEECERADDDREQWINELEALSSAHRSN